MVNFPNYVIRIIFIFIKYIFYFHLLTILIIENNYIIAI